MMDAYLSLNAFSILSTSSSRLSADASRLSSFSSSSSDIDRAEFSALLSCGFELSGFGVDIDEEVVELSGIVVTVDREDQRQVVCALRNSHVVYFWY